jgi:uncharacterized protein with ATP-grasp and redox domains
MQTTIDCIPCLLKQGIRISKFTANELEKTENILREIIGYLHGEDYGMTPPYLAKNIYGIISKHTGIDDPYYSVKKYYNRELMTIESDLEKIVQNADAQFTTAVKLAITGNIIDFGIGYDIDKDMVLESVKEVEEKNLAKDEIKELYSSLCIAKTLLYIGDNCGEIVFDKVFIKYLKTTFPNLKIYFGVRGGAIINDATLEDAKEVGMDEFAETLDNGDRAPGTIIGSVCKEFKDLFYKADVVISKGQGNYETLNEVDRENIYFLFMTKCEVVAEKLGVDKMSLLCVKK